MGWVLVFDLDETLIGTTKTYDIATRKYTITDIQLNDKLFKIILHAKTLKPGLVDAILLLTNNTNVPSVYGGIRMGFLDIIASVFEEKYSRKFYELFDNIYTGTPDNMRKRTGNFVRFQSYGNKVYSSAYRLTSSVPYYPGGNKNESSPESSMMLNYRPSKDIATIRQMLSELNNKDISLDGLEDRIIFFDDEPRPHVLKEELERHRGIYVTIDPPFGKDKTDLKGVYAALDMNPQASALAQAKGGARLRRSRRRTARRKQKQKRRTKKY
jgi:hypothetical protein